MEIKTIKIKDLATNDGQIEGLPKNPRQIRDHRYDKLKKSIEDAPEMLQLRELLGFICELDPHYCDIILARWEKLSGGTAVKIEDV